MALESDGRQLARLYRDAGVIVKDGSGPRARSRLDCRAWRRVRHDYKVVLRGAAAAAFWRCTTSGVAAEAATRTPCICLCLPFALWGTCEHEICVRAMHKEVGLAVTGQERNQGGRGKTNLAHWRSAATPSSSTRCPCAAPIPKLLEDNVVIDGALPDTQWHDHGPTTTIQLGTHAEPKNDDLVSRPARTRAGHAERSCHRDAEGDPLVHFL